MCGMCVCVCGVSVWAVCVCGVGEVLQPLLNSNLQALFNIVISSPPIKF